jgi:hypothetical protein
MHRSVSRYLKEMAGFCGAQKKVSAFDNKNFLLTKKGRKKDIEAAYVSLLYLVNSHF